VKHGQAPDPEWQRIVEPAERLPGVRRIYVPTPG
jgi:hypothetical protein